jgi:hypothetical protein
LAATSESKQIEFKQAFDPGSKGAWCELIKDLVAIANSGGGVILFGLNDDGTPTGESVDAIAHLDPADITNKVSHYTGAVDVAFEVSCLDKNGHPVVAVVIAGAAIPLVFQKPGTYDIGERKQSSAFSVGTVYFRHGAKSEPGHADDLRKAIERRVEQARKNWVKGMRKIARAPVDSEVLVVRASTVPGPSSLTAPTIRVVSDRNAAPVRLVRDAKRGLATFVHEQVSEGLMEEVNNVIDVNRLLAAKHRRFVLGQDAYYRIYSERQHVRQDPDVFETLAASAAVELYAPVMHWELGLSDASLAEILATMFLKPQNPQIHHLMRIAVLLGPEFCRWLHGKWQDRWKRHPQPPQFFWAFKELMKRAKRQDVRAVAGGVATSARIQIGAGVTLTVKELLDAPERAADPLSRACALVSGGDKSSRTTARALDYFAYGPAIAARAQTIVASVTQVIGSRKAGDLAEVEALGEGPRQSPGIS